jgi:hypothetical protein
MFKRLNDEDELSLDTEGFESPSIKTLSDVDADEYSRIENEMIESNVQDVDPINDLQQQIDNRPHPNEELLQTYQQLKPNVNLQQNNDIQQEIKPDHRSTILNQYRQLMNRDNIKQAQKDQADGKMNAGLLLGAGQMAQGFGTRYGAKIGNNSEGAKMVSDNADLPIQQINEGQKLIGQQLETMNMTEMHEPDSDISKFMRLQAQGVLNKMGMANDAKALDGMSAAQLQKIPGLRDLVRPPKDAQKSEYIDKRTGDPVIFKNGQMVNAVSGEQVPSGMFERNYAKLITDPRTGETLKVSSLHGDVKGQITGPRQGKGLNSNINKDMELSVTKADLNPTQIKSLDDYRKSYISETKEERDAVNSALTAAELLESGRNRPEGELLRAIQTKIAKASGEKGALSENDVASLGGSQAVMAALERWVNIKSSGKLPDNDRKLLKDTITLLQKRANEYLVKSADIHAIPFKDDLESTSGKKINIDSVRKLIGVEGMKSAFNVIPDQKIIKIKDSNGKLHMIPENKLEDAKKRDPKLQVVK